MESINQFIINREQICLYEAMVANIVEDLKEKISAPNFLDTSKDKIDYLSEKFKRNIREVERDLNSKRIDTKMIKNIALEGVSEVTTHIISNLDDPEKAVISIKEYLAKTLSSVEKNLRKSTGKGLVIGIIQSVTIVFLYTFIVHLVFELGLFFSIPSSTSSILSVVISSMFILPLIEKVGTYLSIKYNFNSEFHITFNATLIFNYILAAFFKLPFLTTIFLIVILKQVVGYLSKMICYYLNIEDDNNVFGIKSILEFVLNTMMLVGVINFRT